MNVRSCALTLLFAAVVSSCNTQTEKELFQASSDWRGDWRWVKQAFKIEDRKRGESLDYVELDGELKGRVGKFRLQTYTDLVDRLATVKVETWGQKKKNRIDKIFEGGGTSFTRWQPRWREYIEFELTEEHWKKNPTHLEISLKWNGEIRSGPERAAGHIWILLK